jgi:hypothetical protein
LKNAALLKTTEQKDPQNNKRSPVASDTEVEDLLQSLTALNLTGQSHDAQ